GGVRLVSSQHQHTSSARPQHPFPIPPFPRYHTSPHRPRPRLYVFLSNISICNYAIRYAYVEHEVADAVGEKNTSAVIHRTTAPTPVGTFLKALPAIDIIKL
ncbi:hypothetical protein BDBG_16086, partial [Blastomyces gilchristii SLH14081]